MEKEQKKLTITCVYICKENGMVAICEQKAKELPKGKNNQLEWKEAIESKKAIKEEIKLLNKLIENNNFVPPTVEDVIAYCKEKGYTNVNANEFVNYYNSVGWVVGPSKKPMKNWKSAVANWNNGKGVPELEISIENIRTLRKIYPNIDWDSYEEEDFKLKDANSKSAKGVVFLSNVQEDILLNEMEDVDIYDYYIGMLSDFIIKKDAKPRSHFKTIIKWYKSNFKI